VAAHKIVVIDDSMAIRRMVKDMLPEGNFEVLEAKDGVQGINTVRQEQPTLIMLDFVLPKKNGWEVYQELQSEPNLQKIPLVIMSGLKGEVTEKIPEPFEFFEFIEKPFQQGELIAAIKGAMAKAKKPRPVTATAAGGASAAEIEALTAKVASLETEVATLKKQLAQILTFIKQ